MPQNDAPSLATAVGEGPHGGAKWKLMRGSHKDDARVSGQLYTSRNVQALGINCYGH